MLRINNFKLTHDLLPFSVLNCHLQTLFYLVNCNGNPCRNGATCRNENNGYRCECPAGFVGRDCEMDACSSSPCRNGGTCVRSGDTAGYYCACPLGFTLPDCSARTTRPCANNPCLNGATCERAGNSYICICPQGYEGLNCDQSADPFACPINPCFNGATCRRNENVRLGYECFCSNGFSGVFCEVVSQPQCPRGGSPLTDNRGVQYFCGRGPTRQDCPANSYCEIAPTDAYAVCCPGAPDPQLCVINVCQNGAICRLDSDNALGQRCECLPGFSGDFCQIVSNACSSNPCRNGGSCSRTGEGTFSCACAGDFGGVTCEIPRPCVTNQCQNGGSCSTTGNTFRCICPFGFGGPLCQTRTLACTSNPCQNGASCANDGLSYRCLCRTGFTGQRCENTAPIRPCDSNPCQFGRCVQSSFAYTCNCDAGYTGINCNQRLPVVTPCDRNPCRNFATCTVIRNDYFCRCSNDYTGRDCETRITTTTSTTTTTQVPVVSGGADIAFLIDSSGSVTLRNFNNYMLQFVVDVVNRLNIGPNDNQVGVILFNDRARVEFNLNRYNSQSRVVDAIRRISYNTGSTNTSGALWLMRSSMFDESNGARPGYPKVGILMVDGEATVDEQFLSREAEAARRAGILMLVAGIGGWVNRPELRDVATDPDSRNLFLLRNFRELNRTTAEMFVNRINDFSGSVQPRPTTTTRATTTTTTSRPDRITTTSDGVIPVIPEGAVAFSCGFEDDQRMTDSNGKDSWCGLRQATNDQRDWTRVRDDGRTPSEPTGPKSAYEGRRYVFFEASTPARRGDEAKFILPTLNELRTVNTVQTYPAGKYCLSMAYTMFGFHVDNLEVSTVSRRSGETTNWDCSGEQGPEWKLTYVNLDLQTDDQVYITAVRGRAFSADIAIDDLTLLRGECQVGYTKCLN